MPIAIQKLLAARAPRLPFSAMAQRILGERYTLSLVFIESRRSRTLNRRWRKKNEPTNILSFSLSKTAGELFIDLTLSKKQAPLYRMSFKGFVGYLFIHGLLHLKGYRHSGRMERAEQQLLRYFHLR